MMAKIAVYFASCKKDPSKALQFWVPHMSAIYARCAHCGEVTSTGQQDHYEFYEIAIQKKGKQTHDECYEIAKALIDQDKQKFKVVTLTDRLELEGKKMKQKE
jgi:hypothetical protein